MQLYDCYMIHAGDKTLPSFTSLDGNFEAQKFHQKDLKGNHII